MSKPKYTEEFRQSIVNLYQNGKTSTEILNEYGISSSTLYKWIKSLSTVKISETETLTMTEVRQLQKRLAQLEEENLILKKTISIFTSH